MESSLAAEEVMKTALAVSEKARTGSSRLFLRGGGRNFLRTRGDWVDFSSTQKINELGKINSRTKDVPAWTVGWEVLCIVYFYCVLL